MLELAGGGSATNDTAPSSFSKGQKFITITYRGVSESCNFSCTILSPLGLKDLGPFYTFLVPCDETVVTLLTFSNFKWGVGGGGLLGKD